MNLKSILTLFLFAITVLPVFSQRVLEANVVTQLEYGLNSSVYFLYEPSHQEYYKSVVTEVSLENNEAVRIWIPANEDSLFFVQTMNEQEFYVKKIDNPNTQLPEELSLLLPILDNEILFFDNPSHLTELYEVTKGQVYESDDSFQLFLNGIEELYGSNFVSYRTYFNNKYPITESYRDYELNQIERENFISDDVLNIYFNQYRLMGFGDSVYYYHNRKEILAVHRNNESGIDYLKTIARSKDDNVDLNILTGVSAMDLDEIDARYISKKGSKGIIGKGLVYTQSSGNSDWYFQTIPNPIDEVGNCTPHRKGLTVETWYGTVSNTGSTNYNYYTGTFDFTNSSNVIRTVTLKINWGDGSPIQTVNNYTNLDEVYHDYPSGVEATYQVTIETELLDFYTNQLISIFDGQGTSGQEVKFAVGIACTDEDKQVWKEQINPAGSWKMKMSAWVSDNIFGGVIGGYTESYRKQSNGSWKLDKANVKIEVEGTFRNMNDCNQTEYKSGNKQHNNDKKVQKTKTKVFGKYRKFGNGDVKTKHRLIKWGYTFNDEIILNPCP